MGAPLSLLKYFGGLFDLMSTALVERLSDFVSLHRHGLKVQDSISLMMWLRIRIWMREKFTPDCFEHRFKKSMSFAY